MNQFIGKMYVILSLHEVDIFEQMLVIKHNVAVFISGVILVKTKVLNLNFFPPATTYTLPWSTL